jgi:bifunctional UDP-N-acetylglucosamine pyrophosphorylase/glucosamine-1-phosphate N-acetyltransferase
MSATAVILAAGLGTRMKSARPKALHPLAGRPLLSHLIATCETVFARLIVVIGPEMEALARLAAPHQVVIQHERRGTGHAALMAAPHFGDGEVAVLYADNPLIESATLANLLARRREGDAALALLAMRPADPGQYGRVITAAGYVRRIVEWADATAAERAEPLCNAGVFAASADDLRRWLQSLAPDNAKGEFYLTDIVARAVAEGKRVAAVEAPEAECRGINSRAELASAEATLQARLRAAAMAAGVTMVGPETVFLAADTELAPDVTLGPNIVFGPGVRIARGAEIRAFCHLEGCTVGEDAIIGPFARLRPGTVIAARAHVGNFVELKAAHLGPGAKANHLTYLGDAEIGAGANIGAGTITCNYDGVSKYRTVIGAGAFIGSDTALVAPVTIGADAITAAGSVITDDVAPGALAIARGRQVEKPGRARELRARGQKPKEQG